MSQTQWLQSAEGLMEMWQPFGSGKMVYEGAPTNGQVGFAPGCEWINVLTGATYKNVGSSTSSVWIEQDPSGANGNVLGGGTIGGVSANALVMKSSGNFYSDVRAAAGISPSATGADKICAAVWIPANTFDAAGRGFQATVLGIAAANGNNKEFKVILGATNTTFPALPAIDGTVTVTGGTTIGDTGALTTNNGGLLLTCQIFKRGAAGSNTQQSTTTAIVGGATHGGVGKPTDQTFTESSNLLLVVTAQATTTASDIVYNFTEVTGFN